MSDRGLVTAMATRPASVGSTATERSDLASSGPLADGSPVGATATVLALVGVLAVASHPLPAAAAGSLLAAGLLARLLLARRGDRRRAPTANL